MKNKRYWSGSLVVITATLALVLSPLPPLSAAQNAPVYLPACGADPGANTRTWQQAINDAAPGSTLILPPGVCVVAKCDIAQGKICYGAAGLPHHSALQIGKYGSVISGLTLAGAADGTSVLKLDPNPPRMSNGYHAYCGDTHVLSIQGASFITLRDFTMDGSDGELPEDPNECGGGGRIDEHMFDVAVLNSTDITIDKMNLTKAHGDGLNLIANLGQTTIPRTERISVTNTNFLDNDRAGITFQRNVGYVTVRGNYFKGSGQDQDLDMEPSGGSADLGPYEVNIDNNLFDRTTPQITVTLGSAGGTQPSNGIRFTNNTIRPAVEGGEGGCIFVYKADNTTIANNTVIGGRNCITLEAQKATHLRVENNYFEGYGNMHNAGGFFAPLGVIRIAARVVNETAPGQDCGSPPKAPCPYMIYYPDGITITKNTIVQQVQYSPAIDLNNVDQLVVDGNNITHTHRIAPLSPLDARYPAPPNSINVTFGVQALPSYGYYLDERSQFEAWSITRNMMSQFATGIRILRANANVILGSAVIDGNAFTTALTSPVGISLDGVRTSPASAFVQNLEVDSNLFACGFSGALPGLPVPPNAFVRPSEQKNTGNIGFTVGCQ
jgi:hypothetical protein